MYKITHTIFTLFLFLIIQTPLFAQKHFFKSVNENAINKNGIQRQIVPTSYNTIEFNINKLNSFLSSLPEEKSILYNRNQAPVMTLPMPDGSTASFRVWKSSIQESGLEAKFPEIQTFAGQGVDDPYATIRFDLTPFGFHAQVLTVNGDYYIDPYARGNNSYHISYYRKDNIRQTGFGCEVTASNTLKRPVGVAAASCRGAQLFTYRLAVACTGEYAVAVGGTTPALLHAAIVTTVNRVVGVYENELSIRLVLIADNDKIEYLNKNTDPFKGNNDANVLIDESQTVIDNKIGTANYDIGHTFSTGGGGLAALGVVCFDSQKASGITGNPDPKGDSYDIDYVAHEIGHQFGASHSYNSSNSNCSGSREPNSAYEVGGGTSIMAYAGLCGGDDIQPNSSPYFHAISFDEIIDYAESSSGNCKVSSPTGNKLPQITSMSNNNANIPLNTPFTLNATATDPDGDAITFSWEEWDLGPGSAWNNGANSTTSPIFKSRIPKTIGSRTFPAMERIIANYLPTIPAAVVEGLKGETLPRVGREIKFRLTVRDNRAAGGGVVSGGSGCQTGLTGIYKINAIANTGPFLVTIPNGGESWVGGTARNITWDVAGTNAAPINTANVSISLSTDGGLTYPTVLIASTPNDGSETVNIPNTPSTTARIKIEAVGNIYFDISNSNFTITSGAAGFSFNSISSTTISCGTSSASSTLNSNALLGFNAPINLTASGNPIGTTVSFSNNLLTPGSSTTVTLNNTDALTPGTYNITITGSASGAVNQTTTATFIVSPGAAPLISTQPSDAAVCVGDNAVFTAAVQGSGFNFQWQMSSNGGSSYTDITGAQSSSYTINNVNAGLDNNKYRLNISNNCSNVNTNAATLKINSSPSITTQPSNLVTCSGDNNKTISVAATGAGLDYQWQISTNGGLNFSNISGAKSSSINLNAISLSQNNEQYKVVINGTCPGTVTSNTAILTVNPVPLITATSSKTLVCSGTPVTLTATGAITYTWSPVTLTGSSVSVTPKVNPSFPNQVFDNEYTVIGKDGNNCIGTQTIKVTAKPLPQVSLTASPSNTSLTPGKTIELKATVLPASGFTLIWKKNETIISNTASVLTVGLNDLGSYTVEAVDVTDNCNGKSSAVQIKDSVTNKLFIYPNPNNGVFNISYYNNTGTSSKKQTISIYDSHGSRVYINNYTINTGYNLENIKVPGLASGLYLIVISDSNGEKIFAEKVLIKP